MEVTVTDARSGSPHRSAGLGRGAPVRAVIAVVAVTGCGGATGPQDSGCGSRIDLASGETCTILLEANGSFELAPGPAGSEYLLAIQSASMVPAARASLSFHVEGPGGANLPTERAEEAPTPARRAGGWASRAEFLFRRNARRELARVGARPYRGVPGKGIETRARIDARAASGGTPPEPGTTVLMRNSVAPDLSVDCGRTEVIDAVVRAVGTHFVVLEDPAVQGLFDTAAYDAILAGGDDLVFPVDTTYFGSPADLDDNGRVILFFTPIVNRVTPRGSGTFIAGFFNPSDLSNRSDCNASNQGEVLYVLAPDPAGQFGDLVTPEFAAANGPGVAAHELTHLLEAEQRIVIGGGDFTDLEDPWLSEGFAHTAETAVGFFAAGLNPGGNYGFARLAADVGAFNTYQIPNLRRAGFYLQNPAGALALGDEMSRDPGGERSLQMRGFAWLLLRWLADHAALPGGGILGGAAEESMFRDLLTGGPLRSHGVANIERVAAPLLGAQRWRDLLAGFALVPLADDAAGSPSPEAQLTTFDLHDDFEGMNQAFPDKAPFTRPYPLAPTPYALDTDSPRTFDFDVRASGARFFLLTSAEPHGAVALTLTTQGGGAVPASVQGQLIIQRTN